MTETPISRLLRERQRHLATLGDLRARSRDPRLRALKQRCEKDIAVLTEWADEIGELKEIRRQARLLPDYMDNVQGAYGKDIYEEWTACLKAMARRIQTEPESEIELMLAWVSIPVQAGGDADRARALIGELAGA